MLDAAVFGVPDEEISQPVMAVAQNLDSDGATDQFADVLLTWLRDRLANFKFLRSIVLETQPPCIDSEKLCKNVLVKNYSGETMFWLFDLSVSQYSERRTGRWCYRYLRFEHRY
ncbi:hypothetical protein ABFA25_02655 [Mycobacterium lepromatosis]|uniref:hypothetical protein n=1 Tax=Mycobacterium lepromatosis TaxID=480418 RepID=UPI0005F775E2